jgi:hypothetical protein
MLLALVKIMAFFVVIAAPITAHGGKDATASVVGPMTEKTYETRYGTSPAQSGIEGQTNAGYPTRSLAQAAAAKFNKSGEGKGLGLATHPGPHIPNPLSVLEMLANRNLWFRVAEVTIGGVLIIAGVAAIVKDQSPIGQLLKPLKGK